MAYFAYLALALIAIYITAALCKDSRVFTSLLAGLVTGLLVGAGVVSVKTIYLLNTITAEKVNVVDPSQQVKSASPTCTEQPLNEDTLCTSEQSFTGCMSKEQSLRDMAGFDTERTFPPQEPEIQNDS